MFVSVIIPCHNCILTIDRAVNSVFSQTFTDWELILVNNNSADGTWEKLLQIQKQFPEKSIVILDEKKKGAPAARNKGLYEAKGDWIQFLDADDELLPEKIEHQISLIKNEQNPSAVYGVAEIFPGNTKSYTRTIIVDDVWVALMSSKLGITSANLFKRTDLLVIYGWNENISSSQEYDMMFRLLKENKTLISDSKNFTNIYKIEDSISNTSDKKKLKRIIENRILLRDDIIAFLKLNSKLTEARLKSYFIYKKSEFLKNFEVLSLYVFFKINFTKLDIGLLERITINKSLLMRLLKKQK